MDQNQLENNQNGDGGLPDDSTDGNVLVGNAIGIGSGNRVVYDDMSDMEVSHRAANVTAHYCDGSISNQATTTRRAPVNGNRDQKTSNRTQGY